MTEPKAKHRSGRGGRRDNPGGRPQRDVPGIKRQFVLDAEFLDWWNQLQDKSEAMNHLIRLEIERLKKL